MNVKDMIHSDFSSISPQVNLFTAAQMMVRENIDTLFVVNGEQLIGVIGIRDLFTVPVPASFGGPMNKKDEAILTKQWKQTPVENVMSSYVLSVRQDTPLMFAAEIMVNKGKHPLAVTEGEKIIGVIDRADIIKSLLRLDQDQLFIKQILS